LESKDDAEMEKNVDFACVATARAIIVYSQLHMIGGHTFPVPGGPKRSIPCAGSRRPENKSGRRKG
jgi:hypothetical protein